MRGVVRYVDSTHPLKMAASGAAETFGFNEALPQYCGPNVRYLSLIHIWLRFLTINSSNVIMNFLQI